MRRAAWLAAGSRPRSGALERGRTGGRAPSARAARLPRAVLPARAAAGGGAGAHRPIARAVRDDEPVAAGGPRHERVRVARHAAQLDLAAARSELDVDDARAPVVAAGVDPAGL